jgi:hypothetical protein
MVSKITQWGQLQRCKRIQEKLYKIFYGQNINRKEKLPTIGYSGPQK